MNKTDTNTNLSKEPPQSLLTGTINKNVGVAVEVPNHLKEALRNIGIDPQVFSFLHIPGFQNSQPAYDFHQQIVDIFEENKPEDLQLLLSAGLSPEYSVEYSDDESVEIKNLPLLYLAAEFDCVDCLKVLISAGADLKSTYTTNKKEKYMPSLGLYAVNIDSADFLAEISQYPIDMKTCFDDKTSLIMWYFGQGNIEKSTFTNLLNQCPTPSVFFYKNEQDETLISMAYSQDSHEELMKRITSREIQEEMPIKQNFWLQTLVSYLMTPNEILKFEKSFKKELKINNKDLKNMKDWEKNVLKSLEARKVEIEKEMLEKHILPTHSPNTIISKNFKI